MGSTLLLIERGYNYPLHLWVIKKHEDLKRKLGLPVENHKQEPAKEIRSEDYIILDDTDPDCDAKSLSKFRLLNFLLVDVKLKSLGEGLLKSIFSEISSEAANGQCWSDDPQV